MNNVTVIFSRVADLLGEDYPNLEICEQNGTTVHVFQWQCEGVISANEVNGVKCEEHMFIEKAKNFISKAKEIRASLALTPEYSFPYGALDYIVCNKEKWPDRGKLWCLGTQGESYDLFAQKLANWSLMDEVQVFRKAFEMLSIKSFVSPLIYLFLSESGKLCVIPQFKTHPMADARLVFENPGLCCGKNIFVFSDKNISCHNIFFSLVCADALSINAQEIFNNINESSITIFHPQLNPEPRHSDIHKFREELIYHDLKSVRIITLNWSYNTKINDDNRFTKPWSAFFKRNYKSLSDDTFRRLKERNHKHGTALIIDKHMEIWMSHRFEHCKSMLIGKGDHGSVSPSLSASDEPVAKHCYTYENNHWTLMANECSSNIRELFDAHRAPFNFLYPKCQSGNECDKCKKSDFFFGSLFGHFEKGEIEGHDEHFCRMLVGADVGEDADRDKKLGLILELKRNLEVGNVPRALNYFNNNYALDVDEDFPMHGKRIVNLFPVNSPESSYPEALVVITDKTREEEIEILLHTLSGQLSNKYRNQIFIYYKPVIEDHFIIYDKHLNGTNTFDPEFSENQASIIKTKII